MGLLAARNAGLDVPDESSTPRMEYMRRSTGKDGSVAYSGGFGGMGGSMNLTAISALVGAVTKTKDTDQYKASLKRLQENLEHHETAATPNTSATTWRRRFSRAITTPGRNGTAGKVRELHDLQHDDGSFGNGAYGTGMSLLALALNYRFLPIYER